MPFALSISIWASASNNLRVSTLTINDNERNRFLPYVHTKKMCKVLNKIIQDAYNKVQHTCALFEK